jgi:hypothetical protein
MLTSCVGTGAVPPAFCCLQPATKYPPSSGIVTTVGWPLCLRQATPGWWAAPFRLLTFDEIFCLHQPFNSSRSMTKSCSPQSELTTNMPSMHLQVFQNFLLFFTLMALIPNSQSQLKILKFPFGHSQLWCRPCARRSGQSIGHPGLHGPSGLGRQGLVPSGWHRRHQCRRHPTHPLRLHARKCYWTGSGAQMICSFHCLINLPVSIFGLAC